LLLDVMDTLVRDPFHDVIPRFFGLTMVQLLAEKHPTAWLAFERGECSPPEYYRSMFADGRAFDHDAFERAVFGAYRLIDGIEPLLGRLAQAGVPMHALSNYPVWYRELDERLGLSRFLEWSFVSCNTRLRKPDPQAYLNAARDLGRPPEACLFVDDRPVNCEAARAVGMPAIVFSSAGALEQDLARHGIVLET
jgi:HAD superfamily hydrolase (TIGR01509 family)